MIYRKTHMSDWNDALLLSMEQPAPNPRVAYFMILRAGPNTTQIPGLVVGRPNTLGDHLGWSGAEVRRALKPLEDSGRLIADWDKGVLFVPEFLAKDEPANPNVVRGWGDTWDDKVPSCMVSYLALKAIRDNCADRDKRAEEGEKKSPKKNTRKGGQRDSFESAFSKHFSRPWAEACAHLNGDGVPSGNRLPNGSVNGSRNGSANGLPNQEQEQDQDQDQDQEQEKTPSGSSAHTHTPETLAGARERDPLAEEPEVCVSEDPDRRVSDTAQRIAAPSARRAPEPVVVATSTAVVIDGRPYDERLGFPPPPDPGEAELSAARAEVRALYVSLWQAQNPRTNVSLAWRPADDVALANLTSDPSVLAAALPMVRYAFQARAPAFIWKDGRTPIFSRIAANLSQCVPPDASLVGSEPLAPKPGTHHVMSFFSQLGMQPEKVALNA